MKRRRIIQHTLGQLVLTVASILAIFPLLWIVLSSFKRDIDAQGPAAEAFDFVPTLDNYTELFQSSEFLAAGLTTVVTATATTVGALIIGTLAAYGFARRWIPARRTLVTILVLVQVVPVVVLLIPLYRIASTLGLYDQWLAVIIVQIGLNTPFATWLMLAFIRAIPIEVEEAALIDGANQFQLFRFVLLPMLRSGIVAAGILTAISAWNSFIIPVILGQSRTRTLTTYIAKFSSQDQLLWAEMCAAAVLIMAPIVIFALVMQKSLLAGMTAGSLKF